MRKPSGPSQCFNCGAETDDWDEIGNSPQWVCGKQDCHREMRAANRAIDEQAQLDAMEDGYDRYR
jgi:hypothetical protein